MADSRKILLIVEGKNSEPRLFAQLLKEYELDIAYEMYCYNTNIYELYQRMFSTDNDSADLDLLLVLREKEKDKNNEILNNDYSDIILVFDFEPQDPLFTKEKITTLLKYFNESTDSGKLYINYPMIESYRHFQCLPDPEFFGRVISMRALKEKKYKQIVGDEAIFPDVRKMDREIFNEIITANILKVAHIVEASKKDDIQSFYRKYDDNLVLEKQVESLEKGGVYVLNTSVFFIVDYDMSLILS